MQHAHAPEALLDAAGLARRLDVGVATVDELRRAKRIPVIEVGPRTFRYDFVAVVAALRAPARITGIAVAPALNGVDQHDGHRIRAHRAGGES